MKLKSNPLHFIRTLPALIIAVTAAIPAVHAADLSYNTAATLTLTGVISYDNVRIGSNGGTAATIVDATGADSWTSNGSVFYVGAHNINTSIGTLNLGILNTITATQMTIGGLEPDSNSQTGHSGTVTTLASGVTTINAGNMAVGTGKSNSANGGKFTLGSGATLNLYGLAGSGSRSSLVVGRWAAFNSHSGKGNVDLGAGIANLHLTELAVGKATAGTGGSGTQVTGQMTLSTNASNHLDVSGAGSVVKVGYNTDTSVTSTGTLTIGNLDSTSSVASTDNSTAILIGSRVSGTAHGTLNFNGGTLTITTTGAAIAGGGGTTRALNLASSSAVKLIAGADSTNWIHSLSTAVINSNGLTIDTDAFSIGVSQAFSGVGGLTKDGAGTLTLSTANSYGGTTTVNNGTLIIDGINTAPTGTLTVVGGARLGGNGVTPAAVTLQATGKLLVGISDWTGIAGTGFTDLTVGSLSLGSSWTLDVTSLTAYTNFSEADKTFPILTVTTPGGITGFNAANVTVVAHNSFAGVGSWSVAKNGDTLELVYTASAPPVNDYADWDDEFAADLSDPDADNDGDGMINFEEYAFGLDPTSGASVNPITDVSNLQTLGQFTYTRRANSGLNYTVWVSTDLQDWGLEPVGVTEQPGGVVNNVETVVVELNEIPTADSFFIRVKAD